MLLIDAKVDNGSLPGPQGLSIDDLADRVRQAHAEVAIAFSNAVQHAVNGGRALLAAKPLTPHGEWTTFLKRCGIGERTAERCMQLARLVEANPSSTTDLADLSIELAIKLLSPRKPSKSAPTGGQPPKHSKPDRPTFTGSDIIAAWIGSSPNERTRALNAIGLTSLLTAMPEAWWPLIEQHLAAERGTPGLTTTAVAITPDDLTIPDCLRRKPEAALLNLEASK